MANAWTPERKARQSELIRKWKPWERSTGPKSPRVRPGSAKRQQGRDSEDLARTDKRCCALSLTSLSSLSECTLTTRCGPCALPQSRNSKSGKRTHVRLQRSWLRTAFRECYGEPLLKLVAVQKRLHGMRAAYSAFSCTVQKAKPSISADLRMKVEYRSPTNCRFVIADCLFGSCPQTAADRRGLRGKCVERRTLASLQLCKPVFEPTALWQSIQVAAIEVENQPTLRPRTNRTELGRDELRKLWRKLESSGTSAESPSRWQRSRTRVPLNQLHAAGMSYRDPTRSPLRCDFGKRTPNCRRTRSTWR